MAALGHPTYVGSGCDFVGPAFFAFDGGYLLGHCGQTWFGSLDGGETWAPRNLSGAWHPMTAALSHDGTATHGIGNYSIDPKDYESNFTSIAGSIDLSLNRTSTGFASVAFSPPRAVTYSGFPAPGLACWQPTTSCRPLRFNGAFVLRLSGSKGYLCSAMAWWADRHGYNTSKPNINAVVTMRSEDGFHWTYAGEVATALSLPFSEEGPSESSLAQHVQSRPNP
jgi:hypothetical protein